MYVYIFISCHAQARGKGAPLDTYSTRILNYIRYYTSRVNHSRCHASKDRLCGCGVTDLVGIRRWGKVRY